MSSGLPIGRSSIALSVAGTIAIHIGVFVSLYVATDGYVPPPPATPRVELVEIEVPKVVPPPPPPPMARAAPIPNEPETPRPRPVAKPQVRATPAPQPPAPEPPPPSAPPDPNAGGGPVYKVDSLAGTTSYGAPTGSKTGTGTGGTGGGTGSGTGTGSGSGAVVPVSVASIKTRAMPKAGQDYLKDYPAEAKQLGIEGAIRVRLVVSAEGKVVAKKLLNQLGHGLDELALTASDKLEFTPALDTNDKPVSSVVIWTFTMTLPK